MQEITILSDRKQANSMFGGAYEAHVERARLRKPSLSSLCQFLSTPHSNHEPCRSASLDFIRSGEIRVSGELNYEGLRSTLGVDHVGDLPCESKKVQGRILIVEDLDKRTVELLGSTFDIDPMFFAGHIHALWNGQDTQLPDQCILPSQSKRQPFMNIHYHRILSFDKIMPPAKKLLRRMNVDRKVVILPVSKDRYIGLAQHCISVLLARRNAFWTCLVLVDRPIDGEYLYNKERGGRSYPVTLPSSHFLGGYDDFIDTPSIIQQNSQSMKLSDSRRVEDSRRHCLLDALMSYWSTKLPDSFTVLNPGLNALAYYPICIVAAEWTKYVGVMYRALKQYEYSTTVTNIRLELEKLNTDMRALQRWRRRAMSSGYKIRAVIRMLEMHRLNEIKDTDTESLIHDFEYIANTVEDFGRRLESTLPVVTSLVLIIDSRRSFDETANVGRLTIMALVFVPLTYISSLFSMSEKLGPGGSMFWLYFLVAIPVTIVVFLIAKPPFHMLGRMTRRIQIMTGIATQNKALAGFKVEKSNV